jgi:hypothetical protein
VYLTMVIIVVLRAPAYCSCPYSLPTRRLN